MPPVLSWVAITPLSCSTTQQRLPTSFANERFRCRVFRLLLSVPPLHPFSAPSAFASLVQKHPKVSELHAHLARQPSVSAGARAGDPGARAVLQARVAALRKQTAGGAPVFEGWAQPDAFFPERADIQARSGGSDRPLPCK